ncbi:right-handed parallel beta-helix repeat-containing protein [Hymenobacter bucti]|uniref:Right-handed parallel beta-helix repeat-containing protein n=1 Tax=Hymenobacter bucti TaxID=1844114 RepID=A0ABW4QNF8_9BACT
MRYIIILFRFIILGYSLPAAAFTYYVSPLGDDAQAGTTVSTAWRTIGRVNAATLLPGDRVLFEGGQTFAGSIDLGRNAGTPDRPLVVGSYGRQAAVIASGTSFGLYAYNSAGVEVRHLVFRGDGRSVNTEQGVNFYIDTPDTHLQYLRLDSLEVSGYHYNGIIVGSWSGTSGYADVHITNCQAHANGEGGIVSYAEALAAHHNWYVGNCQAFDNAGLPDVTYTNTGSGIVMSGIDGVLVEKCEAYHNGWLNANQSGGPVGIWGYCCNNLVIQHCESHHNSSGTRHDGGGFDLDGGCTNSILQYNYSHHNGGPGYLLAQYYGAPPMHDLTVRYNVSEDDARQYSQGAIQVWSSGASGGIQRALIHNNTVVVTPPADGSQPKALLIMSDAFSDLLLRNNVLVTAGGLPVLSTASTTSLRLEANCYWNATQLRLDWAGTTYADLGSWRAATGQEQLADGRATGVSADPKLASADPTLAPTPGSPIQGAGLNLRAEFNVSPGPQDFVGNPTPTKTSPSNIGAIETLAAPLPVVLTEFTAVQAGTAALLSWRTASEQNNAYFAVEGSPDGIVFKRLGLVAGHGTSTLAHPYQYRDTALVRAATGAVYYRLQQVDTNGRVTYSPTRVLTPVVALGTRAGAAGPVLQLYPNPAQPQELVVVEGPAGTRVHVLTVRGQLVASAVVAASGQASLCLTTLTPGLYIVQCGQQRAKLTVN